MSLAEVLAEVPKLTSDERRELLRVVSQMEGDVSEAVGQTLRAERIGGRVVLVSDRVIRQSEVDSILEEWP